MNALKLPLPDGQIMLHTTLALVSRLEQDNGNVFLLAEQLAKQALPLTEIIDILHDVYLLTGAKIEKTALAEFFLGRPPVTAPVLLAQILVQLISPLQEIGVSPPGER